MTESTPRKEIFLNAISVFISIAVTLICLEVGVRVIVYLNDSSTLASFQDKVIRPKHGEKVRLGDMITLSQNRDIIYEFLPDQFVYFRDQPVNINSDGFRGGLIPKEKQAGIIRILGIGDSQMFGWGVRDNETYLSILSSELNNRHPDCIWQTINTAVPGYNTVMEIATLKEKGLAYKPDYVIVGFIGNDLELPQFTRQQENYLSLKKSFLKAYLTKSVRAVGIKWADSAVAHWGGSFEPDMELVPEEYHHMVGKEAYVNAMTELQGLGQAHRFEVIVLISNRQHDHHVLHQLVEDTARELNFHFFALHPIWEVYAEENKIEDPDIARFISIEDPHASSLAHNAIGLHLANYIGQRSIGCSPN